MSRVRNTFEHFLELNVSLKTIRMNPFLPVAEHALPVGRPAPKKGGQNGEEDGPGPHVPV